MQRLIVIITIFQLLFTASCKDSSKIDVNTYIKNTSELFDSGMSEDSLLTAVLDYTKGRPIDNAFFHCTATPEGMNVGKPFLDEVWAHNGWRNPGYHGAILPDGTIIWLQPFERPSNGVKGHNYNSLHFAYIGGVDKYFRPKDTRTAQQKLVMKALSQTLQEIYPSIKIRLHNEVSNKACPSFYSVEEI